MKHSRKILALVLMLIFALTLGVQGIALAADVPTADNSIISEIPEAAEDVTIPAEPEPAPEYPEEPTPEEPTDITDPQEPVEQPVLEEESAEQAIGEEMATEETPEAQTAASSFEVYSYSSKGLSLIYTGTDADVIFPSEYNGQRVYGVRGVKDTSRQYVKTVTLAEGLTYIDYSAFSGCYNMTAITLPSTLAMVDYDVFSGCSSLKSVTFPASVTSIGSGVFKNCTALTKVVLPKGAKISGTYTFFQNCKTSNIWVWGVPGTDAETVFLNNGTKFRSTVKFAVPATKNFSVSLPYGSYNKAELVFDQTKYSQKYEIYRSLNSSTGYKLIKTVAAPNSSYSKVYYTDTKAEPGRTYYYKVRAVSNYSNPVTKSNFTSPRSIKPMLKAPYYIGGVGGVDYVKLRWSQVAGASGYFIYRSTTNSNYQKIGTITSGSTLECLDSGLTGNLYYYKVIPYRIVDGKQLAGNASAPARFSR